MRRLPLALAAPPWFEITRETSTSVEGLARLPRTCWAERGLALTVRGSCPVVRETVPGSELPTWCLERHIVYAAEFCLGLGAPAIQSRVAAERWWAQLAQFIVCQSVAAETGLWPLMNGLDHGIAGHLHNQALDLAEELDIFEEYLAVQSGYAVSFSEETVAALGQDPKFISLQNIEARRQLSKAANDIDARRSGRKCCGTMRDCPFRSDLKPRLARARAQLLTADRRHRASILESASALAVARSEVRAVGDVAVVGLR